tara:strand:+ start:173 stop:358 length:186 start_codon:yes stop_codon:yes gene_type:complete
VVAVVVDSQLLFLVMQALDKMVDLVVVLLTKDQRDQTQVELQIEMQEVLHLNQYRDILVGQ